MISPYPSLGLAGIMICFPNGQIKVDMPNACAHAPGRKGPCDQGSTRGELHSVEAHTLQPRQVHILLNKAHWDAQVASRTSCPPRVQGTEYKVKSLEYEM